MKQTTVSAGIYEPYAEALMGIAQDSNLVDEIANDVALVLDMLQNSEEFRALVQNPLVKPEDKKNILKTLTDGKVQGVFSNVLMLLVDRRRGFAIGAICKHYQTLLRKLKNTVLAQVTSTVDLNEEQQNAVKQKVQQMTNATQVELETKIDSDLIGGVIIKIGSQVLDASVRGQLRRISNSLMNSAS